MKQYQLLVAMLGFPVNTIFYGPSQILGQSGMGYYTKEALASAPSTDCLFQSAVENSPSFKDVTPKETTTAL